MRTINVGVTVRVLVTHPGTLVASRIVFTLLQEGFTVRCLFYDRPSARSEAYLSALSRKFEQRVEIVVADPCASVAVGEETSTSSTGPINQALERAFEQIHFAVFSLTGPLLDCPSNDESDDDDDNIRIDDDDAVDDSTAKRMLCELRPLLEACCTARQTLRRVLLTCDVSVLHDADPQEDVVYDGASFGRRGYRAAMEGLALELCERLEFGTKHQIGVVSIVHGFAVGPPVSRDGPIEGEVSLLASIVSGQRRVIPRGGCPLVDARDVAQVHMLCMLHPQVSARYVVVGQYMEFNALCDTILEECPTFCPKMVGAKRQTPATTPTTTDKIAGWLSSTATSLRSAAALATESVVEGFNTCWPTQQCGGFLLQGSADLKAIEDRWGYNGIVSYDTSTTKKELGLSFTAYTATLVDTVLALASLHFIEDTSGAVSADEGKYYYIFS